MGREGERDWRDPEPYALLAGIDRAGLMWEFLRRDPDYIAWYALASSVTRGPARREDPARWGLHFRGSAGSSRARGAADLAS